MWSARGGSLCPIVAMLRTEASLEMVLDDVFWKTFDGFGPINAGVGLLQYTVRNIVASMCQASVGANRPE